MKKIVLLAIILATAIYTVRQVRLIQAENAVVDKHNALVAETEECLDVGDWKCAEKDLRKLLAESPDNQNLQTHLAGALFEQERYEDCIAYIATLNYSNENLDYLKEKSQMLIHEMATLELERSAHFRLEFEGRPSRTDVLEALSVLEVAYDSLSRLFDFTPENKLHVVLHESADYNGGTRPDWVGAVFDGKLRVPVNLMQRREVYRPILIHELTHAFVRSMTRTKFPLWLNEGIAQVVDASRNDAARPAGASPSLKALTEPFVNESSRNEALRLYWYSQKMVEGMFRRNSSFVHFREFIQGLRKLGVDESLQKFYGVTAQQLLDEV
ncbi:MAG: hypothetical protein MJY98_12365 [Fibrobacter sp.]|nr:hypothetical protein [Fibrobacter sp.]